MQMNTVTFSNLQYLTHEVVLNDQHELFNSLKFILEMKLTFWIFHYANKNEYLIILMK